VVTIKKIFPLSILWVPSAFKGYYFATLIINKMNANIYPYFTYILDKFTGNFDFLENPFFQYVSFHFMIEYKDQGMGSENSPWRSWWQFCF